MILGIGIDIVQVKRIQKAFERNGERFKNRVFTEIEQDYCSGNSLPFESYAARFAVKEAVFKAFGCGWNECGGLTSIEVINNDRKRPYIVLHGKAEEFAVTLNVKNIFVSISHDGDISVAVVVLEG